MKAFLHQPARRATAVVVRTPSDGERVRPANIRGHAPFCWGKSPGTAVEVAVTLEEVARMALLTKLLAPNAPPLQGVLRDKHHERKHGPQAYYGQP
jgi:L-ribulose-5-phosphate 4-epimerase